jgi:hypothetical protein
MHELSPRNCAVIDISYVTNCDWDGLIIENFTTVDYGFMRSGGLFEGRIRNSVFRNATSTYYSTQSWAMPLIMISVGSSFVLENSIISNVRMIDDDTHAIQIASVSVPPYPQIFTLSNCLFESIHCNEHAIHVAGKYSPVVNVANCTFAGHTGNGEALLIRGNVTITNSIFFNERSVEIATIPMDGTGIPTTLTLNNNLIRKGYSDIWQGPGSTINYSTTNITGNPLFLGGDDIHNPLYYSLSSASPCIDAGTPDTTGLSLLPYDLAGNVRVWNSVIDMGCYEFGAPPVASDDPVAPQLSGGISATNYPNPFNPETSIRFQLPQSGLTEICVYNLKGQMVRKLLTADISAGTHTVQWNGRDNNKQPVASGMYLYRVHSGKQYYMGKMVLMK